MGRWLVIVCLVGAACKKEPEPVEEDRVEVILTLEGDITNGAALYDADCASCHGADGMGGVGSNLVEQLTILSKEDVVQTVVEGRGVMPEWGLTKSDEEIADVVAYLYDAFGP